MDTAAASVQDRELEAKHRALWALGPVLVAATDIGPDDRVLDVAAGTGNAAFPAAATGASVVASDLCPELLEHGRRLATERGISLEWREANAEAQLVLEAELLAGLAGHLVAEDLAAPAAPLLRGVHGDVRALQQLAEVPAVAFPERG